jgi:hypothetical protein
MIDFTKTDEKDFVFVDKKLTDKDQKEFSAFLKSRKSLSTKADTLKSVRQ